MGLKPLMSLAMSQPANSATLLFCASEFSEVSSITNMLIMHSTLNAVARLDLDGPIVVGEEDIVVEVTHRDRVYSLRSSRVVLRDRGT